MGVLDYRSVVSLLKSDRAVLIYSFGDTSRQALLLYGLGDV